LAIGQLIVEALDQEVLHREVRHDVRDQEADEHK
jgi:hypothetical protein